MGLIDGLEKAYKASPIGVIVDAVDATSQLADGRNFGEVAAEFFLGETVGSAVSDFFSSEEEHQPMAFWDKYLDQDPNEEGVQLVGGDEEIDEDDPAEKALLEAAAQRFAMDKAVEAASDALRPVKIIEAFSDLRRTNPPRTLEDAVIFSDAVIVLSGATEAEVDAAQKLIFNLRAASRG